MRCDGRGLGRATRAVPCQPGQAQARSGIIAPTVPASRVHTICRCNIVAQDRVDPGKGERARRSGLGRVQTSLRRTEFRQSGEVARAEVGHPAPGRVHQLGRASPRGRAPSRGRARAGRWDPAPPGRPKPGGFGSSAFITTQALTITSLAERDPRPRHGGGGLALGHEPDVGLVRIDPRDHHGRPARSRTARSGPRRGPASGSRSVNPSYTNVDAGRRRDAADRHVRRPRASRAARPPRSRRSGSARTGSSAPGRRAPGR